MHRIRAEILLNREPANTAAAEQSLQVAIAIAIAKSAELRTARGAVWRGFIARPVATPTPTPCWRRRSRSFRRPYNSPNSSRRKPFLVAKPLESIALPCLWRLPI
jgi:hypothetical protein